MKISGLGRRHRFKKNTTIILLILLFFFGFSFPTALSASSEDSGAKGWTSTDWFRRSEERV